MQSLIESTNRKILLSGDRSSPQFFFDLVHGLRVFISLTAFNSSSYLLSTKYPPTLLQNNFPGAISNAKELNEMKVFPYLYLRIDAV